MPSVDDFLNKFDELYDILGLGGSGVERRRDQALHVCKVFKTVFFLSIPITALVCFGIMYLRFIVFGG